METNLTLINILKTLLMFCPTRRLKISFEYKIQRNKINASFNLRNFNEPEVNYWKLMSIYPGLNSVSDIIKYLENQSCIIKKLELILPSGIIKNIDHSNGIETFFFHPFKFNHTLSNIEHTFLEYVEFDSNSIRVYGQELKYLKGITNEYNGKQSSLPVFKGLFRFDKTDSLPF